MSANNTLGQGVGSTAAGFEVDANFKSNQIPSFWTFTGGNRNYLSGDVRGDDWSKGPGTVGNAVLKQSGGVSIPGLTSDRSALWQVDGNWGTNVPPDNSVFGSSSSKNSDFIGAGQSPYVISTGSGGPQKNDITNVFLHTRVVSNSLWLFFGAETRATNGSSYVDFEYNQAGVTTTGGFMTGRGTSNGRTVNDLLLVINYTNGGTKPVVGVRTWLGSAWSAEVALTSGNSFMTTNTVDIEAVAPLKAFTGDGAPSSTSAAFQFVEGGLNISALNLAGLSQCSPNATVTVKSRSSPSFTSELKDWSVLNFPLTPSTLAVVNDISPQCESVPGPTIFSVSGSYNLDGTPVWTSSAGTTLSNQSYANGTATATLSVPAGNYTATVTLTTSSSNTNCPAATTTKDAKVNPNPVVDALASPAGSVSIISAPPHYNLSTNVDGVLNNTGFDYAWLQNPPQLPTTGTLTATNVANPNFTAHVAQSFTWTVTATNKLTGCYASDPVTRTITPGPGCPNVPTAAVCSGTTNTYTADLASVPANETWVWSVNNGASINASPANGGVSISVTAGSQNFTLTLTRSFANTQVPNVVCNNIVTVKPRPVGSANPETICSAQTTAIALQSDLTETSFSWTAAIQTAPSGGTISGFSACTTTCGTSIAQTLSNSGTTAGVVRYTVTPSKDGCAGTAFTVDVTVNPVPTVTQPGNQVICNGSSTSEIVFAGAGATSFTWTNDRTSIGLGASGTGTIGAFNGINGGTTAVVATITVTPHFTGGGKTCDGTSKTFTITVNPTPAVDQPGSQVKCNNTSTTAITFSGTGATAFNWTNNNTNVGLAASGTGNIGAFTATNSGTSAILATITVTPRFSGGNVNCDGPAKTFTITVNPTPSVNQPGNQVICNGTNTNAVSFSGGGATSYSWTNSNTSIGLAAASGTGDLPAFTGIAGANSASTTITVTPHFTGGGVTCDGPAKTFTITVNPNAAPPTVTYIPPTCTEDKFKVQVTNPQVGSTYKLTQMDGNIVNIGPYVSGTLIFENLHIGQGYSIEATTGAGCKSNPNNCGTFSRLASARNAATPVNSLYLIEEVEQPTVLAAPNPFSDKIRFSIKSPLSGQGSLELYTMLGQKVKTVYQGPFQKGIVQTFDYNVAGAQRTNLVYIFRIGTQKVSGKLIGLK